MTSRPPTRPKSRSASATRRRKPKQPLRGTGKTKRRTRTKRTSNRRNLIIGSISLALVVAALYVFTIQPERERQAAWKRIGRCAPVSATSPAVECTGVRLVSLRLPRSFAACPRIRQKTGGACAVPVNAEALPHFTAAVARIDQAGLGRYVTEFQTVNRRRCKNARTGGYIDGCVSKHSYGIAADIRPFDDNSRWKQVVAEEPGVQEVIDIFRDEGFRWGMTFANNPDPQHVEWSP